MRNLYLSSPIPQYAVDARRFKNTGKGEKREHVSKNRETIGRTILRKFPTGRTNALTKILEKPNRIHQMLKVFGRRVSCPIQVGGEGM